jgi:hypothetical protein
MLESDTHVTFRIFIDATVIEAYWQVPLSLLLHHSSSLTPPPSLYLLPPPSSHLYLLPPPSSHLPLPQDGRVAMTDVFPAQSTADVPLTIGGGDASVKLTNATSWQMSSIYVTKEEVLSTPRISPL